MEILAGVLHFVEDVVFGAIIVGCILLGIFYWYVNKLFNG